jgi:membrane protease YdiL (CAAX protease family)
MSDSIRPSVPPSARADKPKISFLAAAGWTIGATFVQQIAVTATEAARPGAIADLVNQAACRVLTYSVAAFVLLRVYAPEGSLRKSFALRPTALAALPLALLLGAGLAPALATMDTLVARRFPLGAEELEIVTKLTETRTMAQRAALLVSAVVAFPLVEEVFFRGLLFGGLRRATTLDGARVGTAERVIVATSVYFAASSGDPRSIPLMLTLGMVLGWLRAQSGSVWPGLAAHAAFFAVPVFPVLRGGPPEDVYSRAWIAGGLVLAAASAVGAHMVLRRDPLAEAARTEDA